MIKESKTQKHKECHMFKWGSETSARAIDLACVSELTIEDVAKILGASLSSVKKFYKANRPKIEAARAEVAVSDERLFKILDLWGDGLAQHEIAAATGIDANTVRRLILIAEYDERVEQTGADDELASLQAAHPDKFYETDIRALNEYGDGRRPVFLLSADCVMPLSEETARYKVPQPSARRPITLATSPLSF
jgi:hypothetical protein